MSYICVKCGKIIKFPKVKGSLRHPYCKKCFKEVWNNDYGKYGKWLYLTHSTA